MRNLLNYVIIISIKNGGIFMNKHIKTISPFVYTLLNNITFLLIILRYCFLYSFSLADFTLALVYSCFSIVLIQPNYINKSHLVKEVFLYFQISFLCISFTFSNKSIFDFAIKHLLLAGFLIFIAIITSLPFKLDLMRRVLFFLLFESALFCIQLFVKEQSALISLLQSVNLDSIQVIQYIFPIIIGNILTYYVTYIFDAAKKYENLSKERKISHNHIYIKTGIIISGSMGFILLSFSVIYEMKNLIIEYNNFSLIDILLIFIFVISIIILLYLRLAHIKNYNQNIVNIAVIITAILYFTNNLFLLLRIFQTFTTPSIPIFCLIVYGISALFIAIGVTYIICEGFMANLCYIHDVSPIEKMEQTTNIMSVNIFITIVLAAVLMISLPDNPVNLFNFITAIACLAISISLIPILISQLYKKRLYNKEAIKKEPELKNKTITDGVFQDSCTYGILAICLLGIPSFCYVTAKNTISNWFVISLLLQISWTIFFALRNNVFRSRKGIVGTNNKKEIWEKRNRALEKHLLAQNICCLLICMPYMLIKLMWDFCKMILKGKSFKRWYIKYFFMQNKKKFTVKIKKESIKTKSYIVLRYQGKVK